MDGDDDDDSNNNNNNDNNNNNSHLPAAYNKSFKAVMNINN